MTTEERVERLERELKRATRFNRWLLTGAIVVMTGCALVWLRTDGLAANAEQAPSGAEPPQRGEQQDSSPAIATSPASTLETQQAAESGRVLRANRFILEDENGKVRAALMATEDGPMLLLVDENGKPRAGLGADKDGPSLYLRDQNGKVRAGMVVTKDGPALDLFDENGKVRAEMVLIKDGPALDLLDENGKVRAGLGADKDGPSLYLRDQNGKLRAELGAGKTETPDGRAISYPESSLRLFGPDGTIWQAP